MILCSVYHQKRNRVHTKCDFSTTVFSYEFRFFSLSTRPISQCIAYSVGVGVISIEAQCLKQFRLKSTLWTKKSGYLCRFLGTGQYSTSQLKQHRLAGAHFGGLFSSFLLHFGGQSKEEHKTSLGAQYAIKRYRVKRKHTACQCFVLFLLAAILAKSWKTVAVAIAIEAECRLPATQYRRALFILVQVVCRSISFKFVQIIYFRYTIV